VAAASRSFLAGLLRRAVPETLVLIALGAAAGFALNARRADPLPLDLPGFLLLPESGAQVVFPMQAREHFEAGDHIFVDARAEAAYVERHIEGALSVPVARFDELAAELRLWTAGQPVVVYGSEHDFVSADDLARRLIAAGEQQVVLLVPGLEAWVARGLPVETGSDGILGNSGDADDGDTWDEAGDADDGDTWDDPGDASEQGDAARPGRGLPAAGHLLEPKEARG